MSVLSMYYIPGKDFRDWEILLPRAVVLARNQPKSYVTSLVPSVNLNFLFFIWNEFKHADWWELSYSPDSIADSDASAASSGGKWELT